MTGFILSTSADWTGAPRDGLCYAQGRLCELLHPGLWEACVDAHCAALSVGPFDYSRRARHGVITNEVAPVADGWEFDGSNDYIDLGAADDLEGLSVFTMRAVAMPLNASATSFNVVYGKGSVACALTSRADNERGSFSISGTGLVTSNNQFPLGRWSDVVGRFESGVTNGKQLWLRGALNTQATQTATVPVDANNLNIGGGVAFRYWQGRVRECQFWARRLRDDEIQLLAARPFQMFLCRPLPRVFLVAASGGGTHTRIIRRGDDYSPLTGGLAF